MNRALTNGFSKFLYHNQKCVKRTGYKTLMKERHLWKTICNEQLLKEYLDDYSVSKFQKKVSKLNSFDDIKALVQFVAEQTSMVLKLTGDSNLQIVATPINLPTAIKQLLVIEIDVANCVELLTTDALTESSANAVNNAAHHSDLQLSDSSSISDDSNSAESEHEDNADPIKVELKSEEFLDDVNEFDEIKKLISSTKASTLSIINRWMQALESLGEKSFYTTKCSHTCAVHQPFKKLKGRPVKRLSQKAQKAAKRPT